MSTDSTYWASGSESGWPQGIRCHFSRQPRQHVAVACWAMNTGCPRTGVWRPSFRGAAGASRSRTNCRPCSRITGSVFSIRYACSFGPKRKRLRKLLFARAEKRSSRSRMEGISPPRTRRQSMVVSHTLVCAPVFSVIGCRNVNLGDRVATSHVVRIQQSSGSC